MQKRPQLHIETTGREFDGETLAYRNLLSEVLNRAIADASINRYRQAVYGFLCSPGCEHLCQLLSVDVQAVRNKVVPPDLQPVLVAQQAALAVASEVAFKQHRASYYLRRKRKRLAIQAEIEHRKAGAIAPTVGSVAPVVLAEPSAAQPEPVSLFTAYLSLCTLDIDAFETELMGLYRRSSLGEIESLADRLEIQKAISLQEQMG